MSIFDKKSGFDPRPWLKEKTLACLRDAAELVDLANESDTTPWYSRRLRRAASPLIGRLAPMALLVHGAARKLLLFLMSRLRYSPHPDIAWVSKRFLPVDIGANAEDTTTGYRVLYEQEFIERVDALSAQRPEGLALRLIVEGSNDRKHTTPYREETFGYPGARIDGTVATSS